MTIKYANSTTTSLIAGISSFATTASILSTAKLPVLAGGDYVWSTFISRAAGFDSFNNPVTFEIVKINGPLTPGLSQTVSITRAQDGTVAQAFADGDIVDIRINAQVLRDTATGGGAVTAVLGTAPIASSGGSTPNLSLIVPVTVAEGGTGAITANAGLNNLLPSQVAKAGDLLSTDGTNATWLAILPIANGGTGQTTAPAAAAALGIAPTSPPYLTLDAVAVNPSDRDFVAGSNIILTDGGAGSTLGMALSSTPSFTTLRTKIAGFGTQFAVGNVSGSFNINLNNGQYQSVTLTGNSTMTLTAPTGGPGTYQIDITQGAGGPWTCGFPTFKWPGNTYTLFSQQLSGTVGAIDVLILRWNGSGYEANLMQSIGGTFVPGGDPFFSNVVLLTYFQGANGAGQPFANIVSGKANNFSSGGLTLSTTQFPPGQSSSLHSDGVNQMISPSSSFLAAGTSDFCIEMYIYINSITPSAAIFDMRPTSTQGNYPVLGSTGAGQIQYTVNATAVITASAALSATTWTHIAVARVSGNTRLFVAGTQVGSTFSDSTTYLQNGVTLGLNSFSATGLQGYYSNFRMTVGAGRYTTTFTPPTCPFPNH